MDRHYVQQFKKGSLEMMLLCLIAKKETYGYEIITELNRSGAAVLGYAKEGTVYPILYRLEEAGLIQCRIAPAPANGGSKKYYSLLMMILLSCEQLLQITVSRWLWRKRLMCSRNCLRWQKNNLERCSHIRAAPLFFSDYL